MVVTYPYVNYFRTLRDLIDKFWGSSVRDDVDYDQFGISHFEDLVLSFFTPLVK